MASNRDQPADSSMEIIFYNGVIIGYRGLTGVWIEDDDLANASEDTNSTDDGDDSDS